VTEPAPQAPARPAGALDLAATRRNRPPLWRPLDAAVLPALLALGALLGLWALLLLPAGIRTGGHLLSAGAALAVLGNVAFVRVALRASAPFGGAALLAGWVIVVFVGASRRANGSVVLPASGYLAVSVLVLVYGGLVAGLLAALVRVPR
jgi:hypothetical protein